MCYQGDIRSYSSVCDALHEVNYVFHVASFGISGTEQVWLFGCFCLISSISSIFNLLFQLLVDCIKEINVGGTQNVIKGKMCICTL